MEALILFFIILAAFSLFCHAGRNRVGRRECGFSLTPKSFGIYLLESGKSKYNQLRRKRIKKQRD